jgi:cell division protein FtsB
VRARGWRLGALAAVSAALIAYGGSSLARALQMQREVAALEGELAALREDAGRLAAAIEQVRSDPEFLERLAREKAGLVKPGERVLKLPPTPGG